MTDSSGGFVELRGHTFFSLLQGSALPEAMVEQAKALGITALGITDHDSLAGAMRLWVAAQAAGIKPIFGAEVTLVDPASTSPNETFQLPLLAETQAGYANLCQLITRSRCDAQSKAEAGEWLGKVEPRVTLEMLAEHHKGLIALTGGPRGPLVAALLAGQHDAARHHAMQLAEVFGITHLYVEVQRHDLPNEGALGNALVRLARELTLPLVAAGGSYYARREQAPLRDCLIAIDHTLTLAEARRAGLLPFNHSYALPDTATMQRRFSRLPEALRNTVAIAERCNVSLDFSRHRMPPFPTPAGQSEFGYLYELCHTALPARYPTLRPQVLKQLAHELDVIERAGLASFFLIVWDLVLFARERSIRCQGRGSAAGSIVAYLLGISVVDPLANGLLFERFLSDNKFTLPDIDVDFAHDGREEVIQYAYQRYGASPHNGGQAHVAMVCNHVTFQARSAIRDLGKTLAFPDVVIERILKRVDVHEPLAAAEQLLKIATEAESDMQQPKRAASTLIDAAGDTSDIHRHPLRQLAALVAQIDGCVRHLSIHSGGLVITAEPLDHLAPIEPATMPNRYVLQWDKDDIEDAGLIKFDALSLRTLGMISKAVELIANTEKSNTEKQRKELPHARLLCVSDPWPATFDDPALYEMLWQADTIGLFQVESPAQQQYLPRTRPSNIQELGHEVAIIRPGPIQANAVHPYIRRRAGLEPVTYPHPLLEPVLKPTLGVLLYQEQVMQVAMVIARFTPAEADLMRRAMSRHRSREAMGALLERFVDGATANGIAREQAEAIFNQLLGFASYGFCRSHAASFAAISYVTAWLKRYHPTEFACAILNSQPMGFYPSEVIINDAKRHGVRFLPPDINRSAWDYTLEDGNIRVGLQRVQGLGERVWEAIAQARSAGEFVDMRDFCRRVALPKPLVMDFIRAGLFDEMGQRREAMWRELSEVQFAREMLPLDAPELQMSLPKLSAMESAVWDYELTGLSVTDQFMRFYRPALMDAGALTVAQVKQQPAGRRVRVAGMVISQQRPRTAKGTLFMTIEDETGLLQVVVDVPAYERYKSVLHSEEFLLFEAVVQRAGESLNVKVATGIQPLCRLLE
jgi:error-prone DNA polymerase